MTLLSIREAAERIGVSRQRLSKLIADGRIETTRIGLVAYLEPEVVENARQSREDSDLGPGSTLPPPPGYVTTAEAAERVGRSQSAILQWIRAGTLLAETDWVDPRRYIIRECDIAQIEPPPRGRPSTHQESPDEVA